MASRARAGRDRSRRLRGGGSSNRHQRTPSRGRNQLKVATTPASTCERERRCLEFQIRSRSVPCSLPARCLTPPRSRPGLPYGGGRLLLATAAALEPLDHGAPWAALFGALLEEATGDHVAYPAAFACASLPSHALKLLEPTCSFNFPARPPPHRSRRTARRSRRAIDQGGVDGRAAQPLLLSCSAASAGPNMRRTTTVS